MIQLNKTRTLVLVFVLPTVLRLLTISLDNLIVDLIVTAMTYGLISLWLYGILKVTKEKVGIEKNEELTIMSFLTILVIYPILSIFLFGDPLTGIPTGMIIGNLTFASLGLISIYLLTVNFGKFLRTKEIQDDVLTIFICLAVYPIGIWKYQDTLK